MKTVVIIIGLLLLALFVEIVQSGNKDSSQQVKAFDAGTAMYGICRVSNEEVSKYLKAPTSAKFGTCGSSKVERLDKTAMIVNVINIVDSQNSFGAMLRKHYTVRVVVNFNPTVSPSYTYNIVSNVKFY